MSAFADALRRESHTFSERPDLLWQQLYNRLQWTGEEVTDLLAPELERRLLPDTATWLRLRTPPPESASLIRTLKGPMNEVSTCAVSPDGSTILAGDWGGELWVWDGQTGQLVASFWCRGRAVLACAFNHDGTRFLSSDSDGAVRVWDAGTHECLHEFRKVSRWTETFSACAYSPIDETIAAVGSDGGIYLWDGATGAHLGILHHPQQRRRDESLAFSPDGATLLVAGADMLAVWDLATQRCLRATEGEYSRALACAIGPTSMLVASARYDVALTIWDATTGDERAQCRGHAEHAPRIECCAFSPDGTLLASGGADKQVRLWDVRTGREVACFHGHTDLVRACVFSPDGNTLVTASNDNTVLVWDVHVDSPAYGPIGHADRITACALSPDAQLLLTAGAEGTLKLWNADPLEERFALAPVSVAGPTTCGFSRDGRRVLAAAPDRVVGVWDCADGRQRGVTDKHAFVITACAWSADGPTFASGDMRMSVWSAVEFEDLSVWGTDTFKHVDSFGGHTGCIRCCAVSPDGTLIATGGDDHKLIIRDAHTYEECTVLTGHTAAVHECAFSPDGKAVISASADSTIRVWDLDGKKATVVVPYRVDSASKSCAWALSPDGTEIAAAGQATWTTQGLKAGVDLWDTSSGERLAAFLGHGHFVAGCAFSPDGELLATIATGSYDRTLKLWSLQTGQEVAALPLPGEPRHLVMHPQKPRLFAAGGSGWLHAIDVVGVSYRPLIVTAASRQGGLFVRCPVCRQVQRCQTGDLGQTFTCKQPGCLTRLHINPFSTKMPDSMMSDAATDQSTVSNTEGSSPHLEGIGSQTVDGLEASERGKPASQAQQVRSDWWRFWRRS